MKHLIVIGDWSDDGHGKYDTYLVEIPNEFTRDTMMESFERNKNFFDVDPASIAQEYEDNHIDKELVAKLVAAGFDYDPDDDICKYDEQEFYITSHGMFLLLMFFVSHKYEGFTWTEIKDDSSTLFESYGYGCFY